MGVSFDGPNKLIICSTGTIEVNVKLDIYSAWKEWMLLSDNAKYLEALSVVGGDAITTELSLGATFFLENGWRIRPQEASHTLNINGNIYVREGGVPYVATLGSYNVMVINKVSSLVDSTISQLPEIEYSSFQNKVTIDALNGTTGTEYPKGTAQVPVNNVIDALSIAITRGIKTLFFVGNFTFGPTTYIVDYILEGSGSQSSTFTFQTGSIAAYCKVYNATITGFCLGIARFEACRISNYGSSGLVASNRNVIVKQSLLEGAISIPSNYTGTLYCLDSWSGSTDDPPILNLNGAHCNVIARNWSGKIQYNNFTQTGHSIVTDMIAGRVILDSSCTGGSITVAGVGTIDNNATGTADVDLSGMILPDSSYAGSVYIDTINGVSGTEFPAGISTHPVATIEDAVTIATKYNLREFRYRGTLVLTQSFENWTFIGVGAVLSDILVGVGFGLTTCKFERCTVTGSIVAYGLQFVECIVSDLSGFDGLLFECGMNGTITLGGAGATLLGKGVVAMGMPDTYVDINGANRFINLEIAAGDITFSNSSTGSIIMMTLGGGGTTTFDATCVDGLARLTGLGFVVNNGTILMDSANVLGDTINKTNSTVGDNQALILAK